MTVWIRFKFGRNVFFLLIWFLVTFMWNCASHKQAIRPRAQKKTVHVVYPAKNLLNSGDPILSNAGIRFCETFPSKLNVKLSELGLKTGLQQVDIDQIDNSGLANQALIDTLSATLDTNAYLVTLQLKSEFNNYSISCAVIDMADPKVAMTRKECTLSARNLITYEWSAIVDTLSKVIYKYTTFSSIEPKPPEPKKGSFWKKAAIVGGIVTTAAGVWWYLEDNDISSSQKDYDRAGTIAATREAREASLDHIDDRNLARTTTIMIPIATAATIGLHKLIWPDNPQLPSFVDSLSTSDKKQLTRKNE